MYLAIYMFPCPSPTFGCTYLLTAFSGYQDIVCNGDTSVSVDTFEPMLNVIQEFNCMVYHYTSRRYYYSYRRYRYINHYRHGNLLYNFTFADRISLLTNNERNNLVAEWFEEGFTFSELSVCKLNSSGLKSCNMRSVPIMVNLENVTIHVRHNTNKLFPFGHQTRDSSFQSVIERTVAIALPEEIPFYQGNYRNLYVRLVIIIMKFWKLL